MAILSPAAVSPPADPAQTPASTISPEPFDLVLVAITGLSGRTGKTLSDHWIAEDGCNPFLFAGYDADRIPADWVELVMVHRHGKPQQIHRKTLAAKAAAESTPAVTDAPMRGAL